VFSLPVSGSTCFCRHCAQTSFIMHCIGELMLAMAYVLRLKQGLQNAVTRIANTAAIMRSEPMAMMRWICESGTSGSPRSPRPYDNTCLNDVSTEVADPGAAAV